MSDAIREQHNKRKEEWLRQRQVTIEREKVEKEMRRSSNSQSAIKSSGQLDHTSEENKAGEIINRVAGRIADKLRVELREELLKEG